MKIGKFATNIILAGSLGVSVIISSACNIPLNAIEKDKDKTNVSTQGVETTASCPPAPICPGKMEIPSPLPTTLDKPPEGELLEINDEVIHTVSQEEFYKLVQKVDKKEVILIDVRTFEEYLEKHIEKAISMSYYDSDFVFWISKLDRDKTYLLYCNVSGRRELSTALKMKAMSFKNVYAPKGGIGGWIDAGYPIYTPSEETK